MILPFSTHFSDGTPTHFVEKIWASIPYNEHMSLYDALYEGLPAPANYRWCNPERFQPNFQIEGIAPKLHTIRTDPNRRWRAGAQIHPALFNRTPHVWTFAWMRCTAVQEITIRVREGELLVWVDLRQLAQNEIAQLALNDGFTDNQQFYNWFAPLVKSSSRQSWNGRLIHWTNLIRY